MCVWAVACQSQLTHSSKLERKLYIDNIDVQNMCTVYMYIAYTPYSVQAMCTFMRATKKKQYKKVEQNQTFTCNFFTMTYMQVSGSLEVVVTREQQRFFACNHFALLCCDCCGVAPISHVQDTILNMAHPYIILTTVLLDTVIQKMFLLKYPCA